jgi:hypothetical protein
MPYSVWNNGADNHITVSMTFDDATQDIWITWEATKGFYTEIFQIYVAEQYFPALGNIAFYCDTESPSVPTLTRVSIATTSKLKLAIVVTTLNKRVTISSQVLLLYLCILVWILRNGLLCSTS